MRKHSHSRLARLALLALLEGFSISCGAKPGPEVQGWLHRELDIEADRVSCPFFPGRIFRREFSCTVEAEGGRFPVRVSKNGEGARGFQVSEGLVNVKEVEETIQNRIMQRDLEVATVACGKRFRVSVPGAEFSCVIHDPRGKTYLARVTVRDTQGGVAWRFE